jgi:predicted acyl esterase
MGKSYDGWTGLMGIGQKPKGLEAVLSMEPVFSGYRYYYTNGVRLGTRSFATTALFQVSDVKPGTTNDDPEYIVNGAPKAYCYGVNEGGAQTDTEDSVYWAERNLLPKTKDSTVPLFLTQGFLETNTIQDAAFDVFNGMKGATRGWFGQFDHVRGWEGCDAGECLTGKADFADQMMRFFDQHLKGASVPRDPGVEVQSAPDGKWRAEDSWPPADAVSRVSTLKPGSYTDDGENSGVGTAAGNGVWSVSAPLPHSAHLAGEPVVSAKLSGVPRGNFVVNVYDIAPDNKGVLVSRSAWLMRNASEEISFKLYGQDWVFAEGHRIGVLLSSANTDWWLHAPTNAPITVEQATIAFPWLTYERTQFLPGNPTSRLAAHLDAGSIEIDPAKIAENEVPFDLPAKLAAKPSAGGQPGGGATTPAGRLTVKAKLAKKKRLLTITGSAATGSKVKIVVKRGKKRVARKTVTAKSGTYKLRVKLRRSGRYSITATSGKLKATARTRAT